MKTLGDMVLGPTFSPPSWHPRAVVSTCDLRTNEVCEVVLDCLLNLVLSAIFYIKTITSSRHCDMMFKMVAGNLHEV